MVGSGKPTQGGAGVWGRPRMVDQVFGLGEDRGDPNQTDKIQPMVPTRCPSDRSTAFRIGISDPKLATLVSVSDRNARREPAAGVAPIQIPRSPTHPASGRASSYPEAPVARGPYDRRESRPVIHAGRTHARTHHTGGSHLTSAINRCRKSDTQFIPQIRGYQLRLEPPRTSIRRPAGPGSRPRRILTSSDSGLPDPTEPAGYTQPGRFKAARRRGVSPGRLSLRRTRVAATIHHPAAQAAGGNRRSPERTEKSYPPGLKASICEAPGVRGRTPGALGRPHLPTRIARTRGGSQATVDLSLLSSSAPVHQNTNTQPETNQHGHRINPNAATGFWNLAPNRGLSAWPERPRGAIRGPLSHGSSVLQPVANSGTSPKPPHQQTPRGHTPPCVRGGR